MTTFTHIHTHTSKESIQLAKTCDQFQFHKWSILFFWLFFFVIFIKKMKNKLCISLTLSLSLSLSLSFLYFSQSHSQFSNFLPFILSISLLSYCFFLYQIYILYSELKKILCTTNKHTTIPNFSLPSKSVPKYKFCNFVSKSLNPVYLCFHNP